MQILSKSFGIYDTNCYILIKESGEVIVDPGDGALEWVSKVCKNPLAILNTHGHFDHIYDDNAIRDKFKIPIYIPKDDAFLCEQDPFAYLQTTFKPDFLVEDSQSIEIGDFKFTFHHFAGHTPGCSMIEIEGVMFSGDFIFKNSIGRYDFPFSNAVEMRKSLERVLNFKDFKLYPGHGDQTSLESEKRNLKRWMQAI
ncbi:MBL fold metallo-hydrolase [Campylobacter fetus]|uniref:Beta-lactamase n=1 Tax=Campylobacter fetus subsp. testudinum TaxID=1507806 RepID=A0AAX0HD45_CAMFE|nr:MBL fold metallo-hydrolase [Campylobacter fetus]AGZ81915.1 metallo-beta-lactamase family protein [Campylobacter fetus subsp. testudinum 03-427]AJB45652.1 beta-lactamase [Campylobacter fetus subsp. testudinum]ALV65082.1 metallo-beta-lactamase family protein [Campylobacter fetus subsp. testudinum Sp3]AVK81356.1 MBL fold metallo-hydrolase [Campylobacter fetus subsp. testudinum]EAI4321785.1 MBL fold metallo-hydrolase [Campylobacter fetus]